MGAFVNLCCIRTLAGFNLFVTFVCVCKLLFLLDPLGKSLKFMRM